MKEVEEIRSDVAAMRNLQSDFQKQLDDLNN